MDSYFRIRGKRECEKGPRNISVSDIHTMAKGGKQMKKGKGKGRAGGRRAKKYNSTDFARVIHVLQNELPLNATGNGTSGSPSTAYGLYNFSLSMSPRATAVAAGYQEYRIAKVECIVKPMADTFDSGLVGNGTNPGLPHLLYMIDRTATFDNVGTSSLSLKQAGAKPIRLDDKPIVIRWKPTVQIGSTEVVPGPAPVAELSALYKTSPWITTNANAGEAGSSWAANSVDHMGLVLAAEQPRGPLPTTVASVSFRITYEFRRPLWYVAPPGPGSEYTKVDAETLGRDGVVQIKA